MTQVTINLRDEIAQQAIEIAALEGKAVEDYLANLVAESVAEDPDVALKKLASFSDADVLALADLRMSPEEDERLSELLDLNREGQLQPNQKRELDELMQIYSQGTLKKAMGWAEAVRRKLRPPLQA